MTADTTIKDLDAGALYNLISFLNNQDKLNLKITCKHLYESVNYFDMQKIITEAFKYLQAVPTLLKNVTLNHEAELEILFTSNPDAKIVIKFGVGDYDIKQNPPAPLYKAQSTVSSETFFANSLCLSRETFEDDCEQPSCLDIESEKERKKDPIENIKRVIVGSKNPNLVPFSYRKVTSILPAIEGVSLSVHDKILNFCQKRAEELKQERTEKMCQDKASKYTQQCFTVTKELLVFAMTFTLLAAFYEYQLYPND